MKQSLRVMLIMVSVVAIISCGKGRDGIGAEAHFNHPRGVAVDNKGNIYVADSDNHTIRKILPGGVVITLAGKSGCSGYADGIGNEARFNYPRSLALDLQGNIYVADTANHTIRKITPKGMVTTFAGKSGVKGGIDGKTLNARFDYPAGVAVDKTGNVYIADTGNCTIRKITPMGDVTKFAGSVVSPGSNDGVLSEALFNGPSGLALDGRDNLYVADGGNQTVRIIKAMVEVKTLAGKAKLVGNIDGAGCDARFYGVTDVAVNDKGSIYVADTRNHTIRKIDSAGNVITYAGKASKNGLVDGIGADALFNKPSGIAVDNEDNVYVADTKNNCIRMIAHGGVVKTLAGRDQRGRP